VLEDVGAVPLVAGVALVAAELLVELLLPHPAMNTLPTSATTSHFVLCLNIRSPSIDKDAYRPTSRRAAGARLDNATPAHRSTSTSTPPPRPASRADGSEINCDNPPMAYDEDLANRIRELIATEDGLTEKRMFGGLAFLIDGHMSVSVSGRGGLLLRCDPAEAEKLRGKPHAGPFEMRGRVMDGWLRIDPEGVRTKRQLERWVDRGVIYARSLPPKG
jgi:TfoX/Sxy family transcriptional regulator of competence genes